MRVSALQKTAVSAITLSLFQLSEARVAQRDTPTAVNPPEFDNWAYMGCYTDSQAARTLGTAAHFGEHVDDNNCIYQCMQLGYIFAGVEYSGQCFCGNYVNTAATKRPESDCYMACTKTPSQACGGPDRINLYNLKGATPSAAPVAAVVSQNPGVDGFTLAGCYSDNVGYRTLANQVNVNSMTAQNCVDACNGAGYSLAGLEYASQCFCDNTLANGVAYSDYSNCNNACKGNSSEYCGGAGALTLYSKGGAKVVSAAAPTTAATPTASASVPASWAPLGCYTDNVGARGLSKQLQVASLTVEKCISACSTAGYGISGVEYGGECYCDHSIQNNQGQASDGSAQCNMACSGNKGEICGGPGRLNVYASGPAWVQLGCYSDQPYSRTLTTVGSYTGALTIEKCLASCQAAGFVYAGMEYSNECHCGNAFSNGGGVAPDGNVGCSAKCDGAPGEICGGTSRLSMYAYIDSNGAIAAKAAPTTTSTPAAASPTQAPSTATNLPSGWSYSGCYNDNPGGRVLSAQQPDSTTNTVESCIAACSGLGYGIAGLEYSSQCFCDNYLRNGGSVSSSNANCAMTCSGAPGEICGGPGLLSIYSTGTPSTATVPTIKKTGLPSSFAYQGCFSDAIGARVLSRSEWDSSNSMTAENCINFCTSDGYDAAGTEYSQQCFCGTKDAFTSAAPKNLGDSSCGMTCSGDSTQLCGGPGAITIYTL